MGKKKLIEWMEEELGPFLNNEGYVLYHTEFVKEGKDWFLRIYIEKAPEKGDKWPGNVSTDDCEIVSRFISKRLDELDPIEQNYYLEVSSPGMDRPIWKEEHFQRYLGEFIDAKLYEGINGKKSMTGRLVGFTEQTLELEFEKGDRIVLPREKVSKLKLTVIF